MAEGKQLLPGFNHNVQHQGKLYHVQTEDSASGSAVTTLLFLGGNVLASKKTSYAADRGATDLAARVRKVMEAQHKAMLRELIRGAFTAVEAERTASSRAYAPGELATEPEPPPPSTPEPSPPPPSIEPLPPAEIPPPPEPPPPTRPPPGFDPKTPAEVPPPRPEPTTVPEPVPPGAPIPPRAWGPPVLQRLTRGVPPRAVPPISSADPAELRLDELVLSYLADVGTKRER